MLLEVLQLCSDVTLIAAKSVEGLDENAFDEMDMLTEEQAFSDRQQACRAAQQPSSEVPGTCSRRRW